MDASSGKIVKSPTASPRKILAEVNRLEIPMQSTPQKSHPESLLSCEKEILKEIPVESQQTRVEVLKNPPQTSVDNLRQEEEEKREDFDEQYRESVTNYSALSSDDGAFLECHSYIGDQTVDILPVDETVDLNVEPESRSVEVNHIASDLVDEIVSRAISLIPEKAEEESPVLNKTLNLSSSQEDSLNATVVKEKKVDHTLIIDKASDKNTALDDEINKLTETLSQIKIPSIEEPVTVEEAVVTCAGELNGTFDVSMKDVEHLNETFETATEARSSLSTEHSGSGEESTLEQIQENSQIVEENHKSPTEVKMPETDEHNLSRNGSFEESSLRDSPKTSSVTSSLNSLTMNAAESSNTFVENLITENVDFAFKVPEVPTDSKKKNLFGNVQENPAEMCFGDNEFRPGSDFEFTQSDLDYLLTKGNDCNTQIDRNSLLLRFDPLLNQPVPVVTSHHLKASLNRQQQRQQSIQEEVEEEEDGGLLGDTPNLEDTVAPCMSENDEVGCITSTDNSHVATTSCEYAKDLNSDSDSYKDCLSQASSNATMSIDVIKDVAADEVKINSEESFKKEYKMAELEKKIKNEVLKTEDIEKKLKEAEAREEALLKRITENQKNITKMTGVLEAYEKSIAELIAEKQQIIESYEKKCADLQNEKDLNFLHLTSLEGTFSDLHAKYERSKQVTLLLKKSEESLIAEKKQYQENLRLQEQRYEKMKSHAMQQLELANNKLDTLAKQHAQETAKLKALLKKEEISRLSTNEQLLQKTRENEELVKICDELISGSAGSS